jgi:hypothetical protein
MPLRELAAIQQPFRNVDLRGFGITNIVKDTRQPSGVNNTLISCDHMVVYVKMMP